MTADTYRLQVADNVLLHWPTWPWLLRDHSHHDDLDTEALVASGDCLVTLATNLDGNTQLLATNPEAARPQLEKIIRTLLYLQRHYKLVRKPSDHRQ